MKRLGLLVLIGYTASAGVAQAATYYVAKSGNNGNTCAQAQSVSTPKLTIAAGILCMTAGDTLLIRAGTYNEFLMNNVPSGTSWSSKVRIANYNGETVTMSNTTQHILFFNQRQSYIEFDGVNLLGNTNSLVAFVQGTHHIRLMNATLTMSNTVPSGPDTAVAVYGDNLEMLNLTVTGRSSTYAFYVQGNNNLIEGCDMTAVSSGGVHVYWSNGTPTGNIVRRNKIHNITTSLFGGKPDTRTFGVLVSGNNNEIYNNLLYDLNLPGAQSGQGAIAVFTGSGNKIWNNTIANNAATGGIKIDSAASNTEVRNNIAWGNTGAAFQNTGSNTQQSDNLFDIDPLFANSSGRNFQLTPTSRGVDAGASLSAVTTDLSGVRRPQGRIHDIGAYEFTGQPAASGPPAPPTGVRIVSN